MTLISAVSAVPVSGLTKNINKRIYISISNTSTHLGVFLLLLFLFLTELNIKMYKYFTLLATKQPRISVHLQGHITLV